MSAAASVLLGSVLLGEGDLNRRIQLAAVILTGVALLATA